MGEVTSIQVPEKVITEIVKAEITAQVIKAMNGSDALIQKIVVGALNLKVDEKGQPSNYSSAKPFIEAVLENSIREAAKKAITDYVTASEPAIKKAIELEMKKSTKSLVSAFVGAIVDSAKSSYRLQVDINTVKKQSGY